MHAAAAMSDVMSLSFIFPFTRAGPWSADDFKQWNRVRLYVVESGRFLTTPTERESDEGGWTPKLEVGYDVPRNLYIGETP